MGQKDQKKFFVLKIVAFELRTRNSHNTEEDTCLGSQLVPKEP